jgi:hypothetical protein
MKFRASIELSGKTATGIEVPAAVVTLRERRIEDQMTWSSRPWDSNAR